MVRTHVERGRLERCAREFKRAGDVARKVLVAERSGFMREREDVVRELGGSQRRRGGIRERGLEACGSGCAFSFSRFREFLRVDDGAVGQFVGEPVRGKLRAQRIGAHRDLARAIGNRGVSRIRKRDACDHCDQSGSEYADYGRSASAAGYGTSGSKRIGVAFEAFHRSVVSAATALSPWGIAPPAANRTDKAAV
jgi:hypothetical protein